MNNRITVTIEYNGEEHDFNIPSDTVIKDLEEKMTLLLPEVFNGLSLKDEVFFLKNESGYFSPERTLKDYGVHDGARIELRLFQD